MPFLDGCVGEDAEAFDLPCCRPVAGDDRGLTTRIASIRLDLPFTRPGTAGEGRAFAALLVGPHCRSPSGPIECLE